MGSQHNILLAFLQVLAICTIITIAMAFQPPPLQDFCAADLNSTLIINGRPCKDPSKVVDSDFYYGGPLPRASVREIPGINTLGLQMFRFKIPASGFNPPHTHPRSIELVLVLEGTIEAGFVISGPEYRLLSKILNKGDVFVVPFGLIHFQHNIGDVEADTLIFFNNDNPGSMRMPDAMFFSDPPLPVDFLAKSLQVEEDIIKQLQSKSSD